MKISITRALLSAALSGELQKVEVRPDPIFQLLVPTSCPGVPAEVLTPSTTWRDQAAYARKAHDLAERFMKNFAPYAEYAGDKIAAAGPRV